MRYSIFEKYGNLLACSTERAGGVSQGAYASFNLCDYSGDDKNHVEENRRIFCRQNQIDAKRIFFPRQTHGDALLCIDDAFLSLEPDTQRELLYGIDALATNLKDVCIGISTADCAPILLFDPQQEVAAVVHSGWRGTLARIAQKTVETMQSVYNCRTEDILAVVAPCISAENYEVGEEFPTLFQKKGFPVDALFERGGENNRPHFDLKKANRWILEDSGVPKQNIEVSPTCTYSESDRFFSARKSGVESGRTISCMMMRTPTVKNARPNIVIDKNIPFIKGVLEPVANVRYLPAKEMDAAALRNADGLIVRTRTRCGEALLGKSNVKFIATATIGFDHIDIDFCRKNNIEWTNAPGCNADSVAQYIGSALCFWEQARGVDLSALTIGIVGVGHVGKKTEAMVQRLGMRVLRNDPFRERDECASDFVPLHTIAEEADVISFHTPLSDGGEFPTRYLANDVFFAQLRKKPLIINSARGGIVNETALLQAFHSGLVSDFIIDCWENEPNINRKLLEHALISTPHIAGYSADGKSNATQMSVRAISRFFHLGMDSFVSNLEPKPTIDSARLKEELLHTYPIQTDSERLKIAPETFEKQRNNYPIRRECEIK